MKYVKQAAKETATISARFLLHRRYILSPQFVLCLFTAARALLAYLSWFSEPLDNDFEMLVTSLRECSSRWSGLARDVRVESPNTLLDGVDIAGKLSRCLSMDMKDRANIDLTTPCMQLLALLPLHADTDIHDEHQQQQQQHNHAQQPILQAFNLQQQPDVIPPKAQVSAWHSPKNADGAPFAPYSSQAEDFDEELLHAEQLTASMLNGSPTQRWQEQGEVGVSDKIFAWEGYGDMSIMWQSS